MTSHKRKLLAILATIIAVWIATPIPEATIIYAIVSGTATQSAFGDWRITLATSIVGCVAGTIIVKKTRLLERVRRLTGNRG